jgi:hypothetical protein
MGPNMSMFDEAFQNPLLYLVQVYFKFSIDYHVVGFKWTWMLHTCPTHGCSNAFINENLIFLGKKCITKPKKSII